MTKDTMNMISALNESVINEARSHKEAKRIAKNEDCKPLTERRNPENDEANEMISRALDSTEYAKTHAQELRKHGIEYVPAKDDGDGRLRGKEGREMKINDYRDYYFRRPYDYTGPTKEVDMDDLAQKHYGPEKKRSLNIYNRAEYKNNLDKAKKSAETLTKRKAKKGGRLTDRDQKSLDRAKETIRQDKVPHSDYYSDISPDVDFKSFLNAKKHEDRPLPREKDPKYRREHISSKDRLNKNTVNDPASETSRAYVDNKYAKDYIDSRKATNDENYKNDLERAERYRRDAEAIKKRNDEIIQREEKKYNDKNAKVQDKLKAYRERMAKKQ